MIAVLQWFPPLVGLAAPLLAWLLVVGRASPRATAIRVSLAATIAWLASIPLRVVDLNFLLHGPPNQDPTVLVVVRVADDLAGALTGVFALVAWAMVLAAVAHTNERGRLLAFVAVFALVLAIEATLDFRDPAPVIQLEEGLNSTVGGQVLYGILAHISALAALVGALLLPPDAAAETPAV